MKNKFYALVLIFGVAISLTSKAQTQGTVVSPGNSGTSPINGIPATAKPLNPKDVSPEIKKLLKYYDKQIYFTENKGQWDNSILYKAEFPLGNAVVTSEGVQMSDYDPADVNARYKWGIAQEQAKKDHVPFNQPMVKVKTHEWLMKFANSSPDMKVGGQSKHSDVFNYFIGNVAATNVANYQEVWYNNVYKNVDVRYYPSAEGALEYDIVCKPGFDKKQIAIQLDGINKMQLTKEGGLVLTTRVGNMSFPAPVAYQKIDGKQVAIKAKYHLDNNEITFDLGKYDASLPLIIDPIALRWATWVNLGSTGDDHGHGIWVDNDGSIYVVSRVDGSATLETGGLETSASGGIDLVVGKYTEPVNIGDPGARVWQTYIGGAKDDNPYALEEGPDGNIYIVGYTESTDFPLSAGSAFGGASIDDRAQTVQNIFITKITPAGTSIKSAVIGGNGTDDAFDLRIDPTTNNVVVCGNTNSTNLATLFPSTGAVNRSNSNQGTDILVFKINSDLSSILWMKNYGGTGSDIANIMLQNPVNGDLFVAGSTTSSNFPVSTNAREKTLVGAQDGFVQKLNSSGTVEWSSYFNSATSTTSRSKTTTYSSSILCMEFNPSYNQVYFGGITTSLYTGGTGAANNISTGALRTAYNGGDHDFFITNMDTAQNLIASTYLGGTDDEVNLMGLNVDASSNVFIFGYSASKSASPATSTSFPVTTDALQPQNAGGDDKVFCKISSDLKTELYGTFYGGANDDYDPIGERGIKFANCRIYTIVTSESFDIPLTQGALNTARAANDNHYEPGLVVWANPPDFLSNTITGKQTVICAGSKPDSIKGSVATYSLPYIVRNSGKPTAYPVTYPSATYQWAYSTDSVVFTNIVGATNQNLPGGVNGLIPVLTQKTYFKREISGDACVIAGAANQVVTISTVGVSGVVTKPSCYGFSNGSITVTGVGTPPFKFKWYNGSTNATISGLSAGSYSITTTDGTSCTGVNTFNVGQPAAALIVVPNTTSPATCGNANGSGSVAAGGGTIPYNYTWSPSGPNGPSLTGLSGGTYYITVTDKNSCTASTSIVVGQPETITATITPTNPLCNGGSTGTITIVPSGGVGGYTYAWSNGATTQNLSNIPSTSYSVTITDGNGCNAIQSTLLSDPAVLAPNPTQVNISCAGSATGSATVTPTGGTAPYSYVWSTGATANGIASSTISGLSATSYGVTVTDAHGCAAPTSITITNLHTPIQVTVNSPSTCSGIAVSLTANNEVSYTWSPASGLNQTTGGTVSIANPTANSTYVVTGTDANSCTSKATSVVSVNTPVQITVNSPSTCANSAVSLTANNAVTYTWSPASGLNQTTGSSVSATNPIANATYTVVGTDGNGCTTKAVSIVSVNTPVQITVNSPTTCSGIAVGLTANNAVTYTWSPASGLNQTTGSSVSVTNPTANSSYTVVGTDGNGCTTKAVSVVSVNTPVQITVNSPTTCSGIAVGLTVNNAVTYAWSPASGLNQTTGSSVSVINPTANATYTVVGTDGNSCTTSAVSVVTINALPSVNITGPSQVCSYNNDLLTANAQAGSITSTITGYQWQISGSNISGQTNSTYTATASGTYTVVVTNSNNCTAVSPNFVVTVSSPLVLTPAETDANCHGSANGTASVGVTGGIIPYSYNWSNGQTSASISNLTPATYYVTVTDANGCTGLTQTTVHQPDTLIVTPIPTNLTCFNNNTGRVTLDINDGGTLPYTYKWSNNTTMSGIMFLDSGKYCVTVTDAHGCTVAACTEVTQPDSLIAPITSTNISCHGANNGTVTVAASGGTLAYNYNWNPSEANTSNLTGLSAGTYNVTVTDANNCTATAGAGVINPDTVLITVSDIQNVSCAGAGDGSADIHLGGGTESYTIAVYFNGGNIIPPTGIDSGTVTLAPLPAGQYCLAIADGNGCKDSTCFTITQPDTLKVIDTTIVPVGCSGTSTGSISITVSGGTQNYTYAWSNGGNTSSITGLVANNYTVTVTDAHGCPVIQTYNVNEPKDLSLGGISTDVSCKNGSDGTITLSVTGGNTPYNYNWSPTEANSGTLSSLTEGGYSVTVTDANNCTQAKSFTIGAPLALKPGGTSTNASCHNSDNGAITLAFTGGTTPYSYNWSPAETGTTSLTGLSAATYAVTVTDAHGCTADTSFNITQPDTLIVSANPTALTCFNNNTGRVTLDINDGGTTPYTYNWSNNTTMSSIMFLDSGKYCVTVTDAHGCTVAACAEVTQPDSLEAPITSTDVTCHGLSNGTVTVTPTGGTQAYNYNWSPAETNAAGISGLIAGTYNVTVTDANNCTATAVATVNQPDTLLINIATVVNVSCYNANNGSIFGNVTGGNPLIFDSYGLNTYFNGTPQPSSYVSFGIISDVNLPAGQYCFVVTDYKGCKDSTCATITQPDTLTVVGQPTNATCNGTPNGTITTTVAGGTTPYTFSWSNGATSQNLSGLSQSMDTVTVADAHGCTATAIFNITQPGSLTLGGTPTSVTCYGLSNGSVNLTVGGGTVPYSFSWNNGATTQNISNLVAGNDTVTVTDAGNCSAVKIFNLTQPDTLVAPVTSTDVTCHSGNNGSAILSVTGGTQAYSYNWSPAEANAANISGLTQGTYNVTITDANNCTATAVATVNQPDTVLITVSNIDSVSCNAGQDGSAFLTFGGGTGSYTLTSYVDGFELGSGSTFAGSFADGGLPAGEYCFKIVDGNGCSDSTCFTIYEPAPVFVADTVIKNALCHGSKTGSIAITVTGGTTPYTYNWNNGDTTSEIDTLSAGNYTVTITDAHSCTEIETYTVGQPDTLTIIPQTNNVSCHGVCDGSILLTVTGGTLGSGSQSQGAGAGKSYGITWDQAITGFNPTGLCAGTYCYTVTDANNCSKSGCIKITEPDALTLGGSSTPANCSYSADGTITLTVDGGTSPYTFSWNNGSTTQNLSNLASGADTVTVTDLNNCTAVKIFNVDAPTPINPSISHVNTNTCTGVGCNGSINLTLGGGTAPYTFSWSNGATGQNISGLCQARYYVTVTDAYGCTAVANDSVDCCSTSITITKVLAPTLVLAPGNDWQFTSNIPGEGSFTLPAGGGSVTFNGMPLGQYTITETPSKDWIPSNDNAVDSNTAVISLLTCGGSPTVTFTNTQRGTPPCPTPLAIALDSTNVTCNGASNGSINLTTNTGAGTYTYNWSNGASTRNISGLAGNTYCVTVTYTQGCSSSATACITVNEPAQLRSFIVCPALQCAGNCNGMATVSEVGGTPPYTFHWNTGATDSTISNLCANVYSVTVTDAHGCTSISATQLTGPNSLTITNEQTNASCHGYCDGTDTAIVNGGTSPYNYKWSNGQTTQTATGLCGGITYSVTVTDAGGCTQTKTVTITQPDGLTAMVTGTDISCHGSKDGTATVTPHGGTQPYTYLWSNSATASSISGLDSATYCVTVTDAHGCTAGGCVTVGEPGQLLVTAMCLHNDCASQCIGALELTVFGGTRPYRYHWMGSGKTDSTITGLCVGLYTVMVTDAHGCNVVATFEIHANTPLSVTTVATNSSNCSQNGACDGTITANPLGATPPYAYTWSNGQTGQIATGLCNARYYVTVTDSHGYGCASVIATDSVGCNCNSGSITITKVISPANALPPASWTFTSNIPNNSTFTINGSGGTQVFNNLPLGIYTVTEVSNPNWTPSNTLGPDTNVAVINVSSCNNFTCTFTNTAKFRAPCNIAITLDSTDVNCNGNHTGSATVSIVGGSAGATYAWSNGGTTASITGLGAATYTVTVTAVSGCTAIDSTTVNQPNALTASATGTNVSCHDGNNGTATLTVNGGTLNYAYHWSNGASTQNLSNLTANTYYVTVTDAHGCKAYASTCITQPQTLTAYINGTNVTCNGGNNGAANLTVNGGTQPYYYHWSNGASTQDLSNLTAATYYVTVTDAHGCVANGSVCIYQNPTLYLTVTPTNCTSSGDCHTGCNGKIVASATGGAAPYRYHWSTGANTGTINNECGGTYYVTVTDYDGCVKTGSATIVCVPVCNITLNGSCHHNLCYGEQNGSVNLSVYNAAAPITYIWSNGKTTQDINGLAAGPYSVTVTDKNKCSATATFTINQNPAITLTVTPTNCTSSGDCHTGCNGKIVASATGGVAPYRYHWSTGANTGTINNECGGTYYVTVTDYDGCVKTGSATIVCVPVCNITLNGSCHHNLCYGEQNGSINLSVYNATAPITYIWSNGKTTQDLNNLGAGTYTVTVTDKNKCSATATFTINQNTAISLTTSYTNCTTSRDCHNGCNGKVSVSATGGVAPYRYRWSSGDNTASVNNLCGGTYYVTVTDYDGCSKTCSVTITCISVCNITLSATTQSVECNGAYTGGVNLSVSGGSSPYYYKWSNGKATQDINNLCAGSYSVTVTDSKGCSVTATYTVSGNSNINITISRTNTFKVGNCTTMCNGTASAYVTGGDAPYHYHWSNGSNSSSINGLCANCTYYLTVTDGAGCSKVTCVTILSGTTYSSSARIDESQSQTSDSSSTGSLSMNTYPNPFMAEANIEIVAPVNTNGMLQIVDISGRIIQVIYNGNLDAGIKYSFVLHGENLGSGMYFCRLITNEAVYTNNMIKVK